MAGDGIPAATVVPLRDGPDGLEVLMLRRNSKIAFGGMWVFPGGRVDEIDCAGGDERSGLEAARRAAVREALEEAGIVLLPSTLVPLSFWRPPGQAPKRFDTWFFVAPVREAVDVVVDMGEIHDHGWLTPAAALLRRDAGEYELAPPTWMTLWQLAGAVDVDAAVAMAERGPVHHFQTRMAVDDSTLVAVWEGDPAYESGDLNAAGRRRRLYMAPSGWRFDDSSP